MDEKEYTIDLADMGKLLYENRKPIAKMTCIFVGIASVFLLIAAIFFPKYESEALLRIKQERIGSSLSATMAGFTGGFLSTESLQMESYVAIFKSRSVVMPVIEATEDKEKLPKYDKYVKNNITLEPIKMTDVLRIKTRGETEEKAQRVNQLLIQSFLKRISTLNSSEKTSLKSFLEERLKTSREELDNAENALQEFKIKNKIISPSETSKFISERILAVEKAEAENRVNQEIAEARLAAINSQLNGNGAAIADNVTLQKYNSELAGLESTLITFKDRYTDKHPKMIDLKERIASLKAKIQIEKDKIAALQAPSDNEVHQELVAKKFSSEGALTVLKQKGEALQRAIEQNNAELEKLPKLERDYIKLSRDYQLANEIYSMLNRKLEETKITEFQTPNNVQVIDEPTVPDGRSSPRLKLCLMLAILLGLLCSSGYVLIKELLNKSIRNVDNVKQFLKLPVLGILPDEGLLANAMVAPEEPKEPNWMDKLKEFIWKN